jgi:hypothetical protein
MRLTLSHKGGCIGCGWAYSGAKTCSALVSKSCPYFACSKSNNLTEWTPVCPFDELLQETRLMSRSADGVQPANRYVTTVSYSGRSVLCTFGNTKTTLAQLNLRLSSAGSRGDYFDIGTLSSSSEAR